MTHLKGARDWNQAQPSAPQVSRLLHLFLWILQWKIHYKGGICKQLIIFPWCKHFGAVCMLVFDFLRGISGREYMEFYRSDPLWSMTLFESQLIVFYPEKRGKQEVKIRNNLHGAQGFPNPWPSMVSSSPAHFQDHERTNATNSREVV